MNQYSNRTQYCCQMNKWSMIVWHPVFFFLSFSNEYFKFTIMKYISNQGGGECNNKQGSSEW